jgi:methylated-DNA-protein-cysteine methyltransferase-like protein
MVGYAMAALPFGSDVPWHRVINAQGRISIRRDGEPDALQHQLLLDEGITFDKTNRIDLVIFSWKKII